MTIEEQRLSEWLHEQTPPLRPDIDLAALVERSREDQVSPRRATRSMRRWAPLVAAVAAVALLAAVLAALPDRGDDSTPATPSPTPTVTGSRRTPTPTPTPTPPALTFRPWNARLIRSDQNETLNLEAIGSSLYRLGIDLERIDTTTGRIAAEHPVPDDARPPITRSAGRLWVVSQPSPSSVVLTGYDPLTLHKLAQYRYPLLGQDNNGPALAATGASTLYLGAGSRIYVLDARTGRRTRTFHVADGMSSLAVRPDGARLVVATGPQNNQLVEQLDPATGEVMDGGFTRGGGCSDVQATSGGIFVTCGQGMSDEANIFSYHGRYLGEVDGGGGIPAVASVSGGIVWIGGPSEAACVDPDTGRIRAHVTLQQSTTASAALTGLSVVNGRLYAEYFGLNSPGRGIVELTPPKACGLR